MLNTEDSYFEVVLEKIQHLTRKFNSFCRQGSLANGSIALTFFDFDWVV